MNPGATILVSIATALATSIITFLLYTPRLKADLEKEIKSRFNEQRWQVYTEFAGLTPLITKCIVTHTSPFETEDLRESLIKLAAQTMIVGSAEVIGATSALLRCLLSPTGTLEPGLTAFVRLFIEMKKDLGYPLGTQALDSLDTLIHSATTP